MKINYVYMSLDAGRVLRKEDRCMKILRMIMVGGDQNFSSFYDVFCNTDEVFF